ncbi:restriction endonuclease subunit S [Roseateles sp. 22389]|uniref:restriction endonuclease subunit S n=1 Tax=Roseateles sp. 22389 TaxID=3453916 RepID=UPI003F824EFF
MSDQATWTQRTVADCLVPTSFRSKRQIQTREYQTRGRFPIIDQGQAAIAGWTDDESAVIDSPLPVVVFGDHSRTLKFIDRPFARGADGTQVMVPTAGIEPLFFYYACKFIDVPARGYNRHFGQLKESSFNYPEDPAVQRKIAKCLSLVESAISAEEIRLKKIAELRLAVMAELFAQGLRGEAQKETEIGSVPQSWDVVPFSTVREWLQYGTSTRCSTETASYAVLRIPNIGSGAVIPDDLKYCDMPASEAAKYRLELGDLIFIRTNGVLERLGSCAVYRGAPQQALFASYLIRARLDLTRVEPRFVAHFYGSKLGTSLVAGRATPASDGKYNLNTGTIDALPLPVPPTPDEQVEIADILDAIDAKIALHQQKRAVLEELFKALLHKMMTGEIDVNDLNLSALQSAT